MNYREQGVFKEFFLELHTVIPYSFRRTLSVAFKSENRVSVVTKSTNLLHKFDFTILHKIICSLQNRAFRVESHTERQHFLVCDCTRNVQFCIGCRRFCAVVKSPRT